MWALRGYKGLISPLLGGGCRFLPTCGDYMADAVRRFGALRGIWVGTGRLLRCQPLCRAGHDPVPARFSVRAGFVDRLHEPDAEPR